MEEKDDYYNHDENVDVNRCSDVVKMNWPLGPAPQSSNHERNSR